MLSGCARYGARVAGVMLAAVALALPAASSGAHSATVSVSNLRLSSHWKEGFFTGKINFTISVSGAANVSATVRAVTPAPPAAHKTYNITASGSYPKVLTLPRRPKPGDYTLRVGQPGGKFAEVKFAIPNPSEGVVDGVAVSATQNGKEIHSLANAHELWVRFHFLVPPPLAKTAIITWRTPSFTFVGKVTRTIAENISSNLKSGTALPKGTWYAILTVAGKTAKRISFRVT